MSDYQFRLHFCRVLLHQARVFRLRAAPLTKDFGFFWLMAAVANSRREAMQMRRTKQQLELFT
jgi:hypothetical protein